MNDFLDGISGQFIYVNCDVFPMTAIFYKDRIELKKDEFYDVKEYFNSLVSSLKLDIKNAYFVDKYAEEIIEFALNENAIIKISLKGEHYAKRSIYK